MISSRRIEQACQRNVQFIAISGDSQRIGRVEPVFANLRHNKRLNRLNLRGKTKVNTQWNLYCMVHNIEKLTNNGYIQ